VDRRFLAILAILVVGFGAFLVFSKDKDNEQKKNTNSSTSSQTTNHVTGQGKSGVTLVEYGDYQCPACGAYHPVLKEIIASYNEKIFFQFRNFPLDTIHPNARAAARAAEAAAQQDKFWEMHDLLYEGQNQWSQSSNPQAIFNAYATQLSLDINKFKTDLASAEINSMINADIAAAQKLKATSTPTFVLDGKKVDSPPAPNVENFSKFLDDAIAAKAGTN
jgi:protein-disulfide isomerase